MHFIFYPLYKIIFFKLIIINKIKAIKKQLKFIIINIFYLKRNILKKSFYKIKF